MTIQTWINHAEERLQKAGCPDAGLDARYIAAGVLKKSPGEIRFLGDTEIEKDALEIMNVRLDRREKGEPLQYIENTAYFMDFEFYVDENVLIPRQDTETLVELALKKIGGIQKPDVLDMCTGSGAIAVSLALYRKDARVMASDISNGALNVARKNALSTAANVEFILSDLFESIPEKKYDLITINPPYLTREDMLTLQREVQAEPSLALFGGEDGGSWAWTGKGRFNAIYKRMHLGIGCSEGFMRRRPRCMDKEQGIVLWKTQCASGKELPVRWKPLKESLKSFPFA